MVVRFKLPDDLGALDELLLKGDSEPTTRPYMSLVLVLSRPPSAALLDAAFTRALSSVPRMRQRVARSSWTGGRASWVDDETFDLSYHLRRIGAPGDGTLAAALAGASAISTAPLDPARPLWEAVVVERLVDGRALLIVRAHHAIADGVRGIEMMAALLDLEPAPAGTPSAGDVDDLRRVLPPEAAQMLRGLARVWVSNPRRTSSLYWSLFRAGRRPMKAISDSASYVRSALRTVDRGDAAPSPLFANRSSSRRYATLEIPLDAMKSTAQVHGVTLNDVYLAALLGGWRRYHEAFDIPAADVPLALPIDVSGTQQHAAGNHISAAIIPGPASISDPAERLRAVHRLVLSRRAEPGLGAVNHLAPTFRQVPAPIAIAALGAHARRVDLQASNLMGPPCPVYIAGERVERLHAFGPLPGLPVMAVLISYEGVCSIGLTLDPAAVTDIELFLTCLHEGFDEILGPTP
jgi:WS/DGAT/MGAT family acyltransferase